MKYLLFLGIGIVLMPLMLISLQTLTGWGIVASSTFNLLLHWLIFALLTGIIPLICEYILRTSVLRISFIVTLFSWLMTVLVVFIFYDYMTETTMGWMRLEMNYIYFSFIYLISILICLSVIKQIRARKK